MVYSCLWNILIERPEQQKKIMSIGEVYQDNRRLEFLNDNKSKIISASIKRSKINKGKGKGRHTSSTESRRVAWEFIVWPLILQVNRIYFTNIVER